MDNTYSDPVDAHVHCSPFIFMLHNPSATGLLDKPVQFRIISVTTLLVVTIPRIVLAYGYITSIILAGLTEGGCNGKQVLWEYTVLYLHTAK